MQTHRVHYRRQILRMRDEHLHIGLNHFVRVLRVYVCDSERLNKRAITISHIEAKDSTFLRNTAEHR